MIIDKDLRFSNAQVITSTAPSTDVIDLGIARNIGVGENLYLVVQVATILNDSSGTDATVQVDLEADNDVAFGSVDFTQRLPGLGVAGTAPFAHGSAAGTRRVMLISPNVLNSRYARLNYTVAAGPLNNSSALTAFICSEVDLYTAYTSGVTIEP